MLERAITNKPSLNNNISTIFMIIKGFPHLLTPTLVIIAKRKTRQGTKHIKKEERRVS